MDSLSGMGLEEKAKKEYRAGKQKVLIITFMIALMCGGILYLHFKGYNCMVIAIILAILDAFSFLYYFLSK